MESYFNTSHVNVNPLPIARTLSDSLISIHLMLMLIESEAEEQTESDYFNTSHVNVNLYRKMHIH